MLFRSKNNKSIQGCPLVSAGKKIVSGLKKEFEFVGIKVTEQFTQLYSPSHFEDLPLVYWLVFPWQPNKEPVRDDSASHLCKRHAQFVLIRSQTSNLQKKKKFPL